MKTFIYTLGLAVVFAFFYQLWQRQQEMLTNLQIENARLRQDNASYKEDAEKFRRQRERSRKALEEDTQERLKTMSPEQLINFNLYQALIKDADEDHDISLKDIISNDNEDE
jgi:hypothetical protein